MPIELLASISPIWDTIATNIKLAKSHIDKVERTVMEIAPTSLAFAGCTSAVLRVGKVTKACLVRDVAKSLTAIRPAIVKVNLGWAGIETMTDFKDILDLIPLCEEVISLLNMIEDDLKAIDLILNPPISKLTPSDQLKLDKKNKLLAAARVVAFQKKKKRREEGLPPESEESLPRPSSREKTSERSSGGVSRSTSGLRSTGTVGDKSNDKMSAIASLSYMNNKNTRVRNLKDKKVEVDEDLQDEFGTDPLNLLMNERATPINVVDEQGDLSDYFTLRAEMRKNPGGFRPSSMTSGDIMGLMLTSKPTTAPTKSTTLKLKGSKWGEIQGGVKGTFDLQVTIPTGGDDVVEEDSIPVESSSRFTTAKTSEAVSRKTGGDNSRVISASILKPSSAGGVKSAGAISGRTSKISFDVERSPVREENKRAFGLPSAALGMPPNTSTGVARISTAPDGGQPNQRTAHTVGSTKLTETELLEKEIVDLRAGTKMDTEKLDMESFKMAFHESSVVHLEQPVEQPETKSGGGFFGKIKTAGKLMIKNNVEKVGGLTASAIRVMTPELSFGKKKNMEYKVSNKIVPDVIIVQEAVEYWTKQVEKDRETLKSENGPEVDEDEEEETMAYIAPSGTNSPANPGNSASPKPKKKQKPKSKKFEHEDVNKADAHNPVNWAEYSLALALSCDPDKEEKTLELLEKVKENWTEDPSPYLRLGKIKSASFLNTTKNEGLELLRTAHNLSKSGEYGIGLREEVLTNYGAAAYEYSELKNATAAYDFLLENAAYLASDEAMCTRAQICLRRGQYAEAQHYYSNLGIPDFQIDELHKALVADGKEMPNKQTYTYPRLPPQKIGSNLIWARAARRKETMARASEAYQRDPRHLSR